MTNVDILSYVRERCERYWDQGGNYPLRQLLEDLKYPLHETTLSKALSGETEGRDELERCLSWAPARALVEDRLALHGLFSCSNINAIDELLDLRDGVTAEDYDAAEAATTSLDLKRGENPLFLHSNEAEAAKSLIRRLATARRPLISWQAGPESGASIIAYSLRYEPDFARLYDEIILVRSASLTRPFDEELRCIERRLRKPGRAVATASELIEALSQERILMILLDAGEFPNEKGAQSRYVWRVVAAAEKFGTSWDNPAPVLVVGQIDGLDDADPYAGTFSVKLNETLRLPSAYAYRFFRAQWNRFSGLRKDTRVEEAGPRFKRAKWHYADLVDEKVWPISVRMRALFASNMDNHAYFDPTGGFKRLAGFDELPVDAELHYRDLWNFLDRTLAYNQSHLQALRAASTAKHWLTTDALRALSPPFRPFKVPRTTMAKYQKAFDKLGSLVSTIDGASVEGRGVRKDKKRYIAGLAVKAIVQDHWMDQDVLDRSLAHFRIAKRLLAEENNKELLQEEFPYEPHRGRSRIFFLSEALRHFIRSCDRSLPKKMSDGSQAPANWLVPGVPKSELGGTDPRDAINYCYHVLFQRELNGNKAKKARALAERHGAYQLSVEMLQLLSADGVLGTPHPTLHRAYRRSFLKDCGFALLDIGEVKRSENCFLSLLKEGSPEDNTLLAIEGNLDLIQALTASYDLDQAHQIMKSLDELFLRRADTMQLLGEVPNEHYRRLLRRYLGMDGLLYYLEDDPDKALSIFAELETGEGASGYIARYGAAPMEGAIEETLLRHVVIAALLRGYSDLDSYGSRINDERAFNMCMKSMLEASTDGRDHEAMGFRISLAHMLGARGQVSAAETIMDVVHREILRFGCSERTFLAFLLEAGRIMIAKGKFVRAYSTYLRPCILRARSRGYPRQEKRARHHGSIALNKALDLQRKDDKTWQAHLEEADAEQGRLRDDERPVNIDLPPLDPLFGYSTSEADRTIRALREKGIEAELAFVAPERPGVATFETLTVAGLDVQNGRHDRDESSTEFETA